MKLLNASVVLYKSDKVFIQNIIDSFLSYSNSNIIYLIDNSPTDCLRNLGDNKKIIYIHCPENKGFGAGHNIAFKKSIEETKYHVIINPDIKFGFNVLEELVGYMEKNADIGVIMPKVKLPNKSIQYLCKLLPNPYHFFMRRFFNFMFKNSKLNHKFEMRLNGYNELMEVPFLSGCFLMFRMDTLKIIGLFDEKIFMYCEDIDICRRIWVKAKNIFYPYVAIEHHHERKSFTSIKNFKIYLKSTLYYFMKWGFFWDKERNRINKEALSQSIFKK